MASSLNKEEEKIVPFMRQPSKPQWYHYLLAPIVFILAPISLVIRILLLAYILIGSSILLFIPALIAKYSPKLLGPFVPYVRLVVAINTRILLLALHIWVITYKKPWRPKTRIIVSNHVTFFDILAMMKSQYTSFLSKKSIQTTFFIGMISNLLGSVYVDREARKTDFEDQIRSRYGAEIVQDASETKPAKNQRSYNLWNRRQPIVIFPEGTTGNMHSMLRFKTGAFRFNLDVQVVAIRYHAFFDVLLQRSMKSFIWRMMLNPLVICVVEYGPVLHYNDYKSHQEFADAAGEAIAKMNGTIYSKRYDIADFMYFRRGKTEINCSMKNDFPWMGDYKNYTKLCQAKGKDYDPMVQYEEKVLM